MLWPFAAADLAMESFCWLLDSMPKRSAAPALPWTTGNTVALELPTMRLRKFSTASSEPTLVCAPYALHRSLVADFLTGHSVIETLQHNGLETVYLTDWRSACSEMRFFSIDTYLSDLNIVVDDIGRPVNLVGLCQGGWLSLLYGARFPEKVRRLVLAGAPVDLSVESSLSRLVHAALPPPFGQLAVHGGEVVSGQEILRLWTKSPTQQDVQSALQRILSAESTAGVELLDRFQQWNEQPLDLPGTYYLQILDWIFRENRIANGKFVALGREIHLQEVRMPVFLLAGHEDDVVPPQQALATARLLGTPTDLIETAVEPCNHLALFMGAKTHAVTWARIARWLQDDRSALRARSA